MIMRTSNIRNPYVFAVTLLAIFILVDMIAGGFYSHSNLPVVSQVVIADSALALIGIALLGYLGWWEVAGYTRLIRLRELPLFLLPLVISLLSLSSGVVVTAPLQVVTFALFALLIGFSEETFFRGLMVTSLLPRGVSRAVIISSFLFAAPHLLNVLAGIWDPLFALADTIAAFGIGITFAALRVRTGSIWPLIGLHALIDFCALLALGSIEITAQSAESLTVSVFIGILLTGYGLFLISEKFGDRFTNNS
jgi:CAAX protease family protein